MPIDDHQIMLTKILALTTLKYSITNSLNFSTKWKICVYLHAISCQTKTAAFKLHDLLNPQFQNIKAS